jgi:DNA-binding PadR family transcriptional regulator
MNEPNEHIDHRGRGRGRRGMPDGEGRPRHGRMRRGDVATALLIALLDRPAHGYELIQAIEAKAEGRWRPSPGAVYPALQLLVDQSLITAAEHDGKRVFEMTDAGRRDVEERIATHGYPWDERNGEHGDLRRAVRDLHLAAKQVGVTGSPETVTRAVAIVTDARKALYRLLAE